jgi:hypothetical protein
MTKKEIKNICEYYNIENYVINDDYSVDVISNVNLSRKKLNEIPICSWLF